MKKTAFVATSRDHLSGKSHSPAIGELILAVYPRSEFFACSRGIEVAEGD
nr:L749 [uncultured bacterium]